MLVTHKFGDHVVHRELDAFTFRIHLWVVGRGMQVGDTQLIVQGASKKSNPLFLLISQ